MPFLRYFTQTALLPSVTTSAPVQGSPHANIKRHGDTLNYEQFTLATLVDEDLLVWEETHNWLRALTKPQEYEQYKRFYTPEKKLYHDGVLTLNTNANNPNLRIIFRNCHPVGLGLIHYDAKQTADTTPTVDVTFEYDYFEIVRT